MGNALGAYADPDIHYAVVGGNLVANAVGSELLVPAGHTFTPGGDVNATSIKILGTVNGGSNTFNIAENWNSTPGDWNAETSTVNLLGTGVLLQNTSATPWVHGFNNLSVATAGQTTTMSSVIWANQLTTGSGVFTDAASSHSFYLQGTGNVFVDGGGTLDFDSLHFRANNATQNIVGRDYSGINSVYFDAVGGLTGSGVYEMQGNLIANDVHIIVNNDGNPGYVRNAILNTNNFDFIAANFHVGVNGQTDEYAVFNAGSSIVNIAGDVNVYASDANGTNVINAASSNWTVSGNWTNSDSFNAGTSSVVLDGTATLNAGANAFYDLTTGAASQVTTLTGDLSVSNVLTIADATGTLTDNAAGYNITVTGTGTPFVNNGAAVTANKFTYENANNITIIAAGGTYNITESLYFAGTGTGAGTTYQLDGDLLVNGNIDVYATSYGVSILNTFGYNVTADRLQVSNSAFQVGILNANNSTVDINGDVDFVNSVTTNVDLGTSDWYVSGNWTNHSNTFSAGTSTVTLDGGDQTLSGSTSFYNLTKVEGSNDGTDSVLTFDNTATQTINGTLTLNGLDADDRINLVSDSPGNQWGIILTATATQAIDYIEVTDSDASGSDISQKYINPADSVDGSNNIDWFGNFAPTAASNTVTTNEDTTYTFTAADFNYSDIELDVLASIKITSLETVGALQLSGADVTLNQVITKADIDAGNLKFVPVADENGSGYDSFGFSVNDGVLDSVSTYTQTIDVTAINDVPVATGNTVIANEDVPLVIGASDFNFTDVESDALASVTITGLNLNGGTLTHSAGAVKSPMA